VVAVVVLVVVVVVVAVAVVVWPRGGVAAWWCGRVLLWRPCA
jgi:hypothetical protein